MLHQKNTTTFLPPEREEGASFGLMLTSMRPWVVRLCLRWVKQEEAAEDLAQETLLAAWKDQGKLQKPLDQEMLTKWLRVIARHMCFRWARNHGRELAHHAPIGSQPEYSERLEHGVIDTFNMEIELEQRELAELLSRALDYLPLGIRETLVQRYLHGISHDEIRQRFNMSEDALVQRLYRGKRALRRVLLTQMREELATYGIVPPDEGSLHVTTRMWCPFCGTGHLIKSIDSQHHKIRFSCQHGCPVVGLTPPERWQHMSSAQALLGQQVMWLERYYWRAINDQPSCLYCGRLAQREIRAPSALPSRFLRFGAQQGLAIVCMGCGRTHFNTVSHLTFDLTSVQQFWRDHPQMQWHLGSTIEYADQPALVSHFQSKTDGSYLDVVCHRDSLKVLTIHGNTMSEEHFGT
ncbi:RNA polymerase sigma factor [Ktedonospora formicarum]|uniref:RNA polymerase sigma-70 region 2 domain-containing protein n=1 Tax=Ktedonospora formicarum TaxID=2778364 RepID=A0A8J3MSI8_9CHLR|nr:RNA polymerase sigma factor [Ktedonospora formicarum]GHO47112.1 hypothetical protein KSX_52750 [Ktedonospora formicarum]